MESMGTLLLLLVLRASAGTEIGRWSEVSGTSPTKL